MTSALLGSLSSENQCDSLRLDGRVVYRGYSQLTRFTEHPKATRDGGLTLSWDHGPAEVFPHTGTPETAESVSSPITGRSESQPIYRCCCQGLFVFFCR